MIEQKIIQAKPEQILSDDFMGRLRTAIHNVGASSMANPFASAAGWTLIGLATTFTLLVAIGRLDMLPEIVSKLVRFVGGS